MSHEPASAEGGDLWAARPAPGGWVAPAEPRRPRPVLFAVCLVVGAVSAFYAIWLSAAAWALGHDDDPVSGLVGIVLLPLLIALAALGAVLAVGLLVTAAVCSRPLAGSSRKPLLLLWVLPVAGIVVASVGLLQQ